MDLFTYVLKHDGGFAPNPFGDVCTLATCKPAIRRTARVGDWIAGFGSVEGVGAGLLVYAMRVGRVMPLDEYGVDPAFTAKRPQSGGQWWQPLGDAQYHRDESGEWRQRRGCHGPGLMKKDLSGLNALVADEFYYLGHKAVALPASLKGVVTQTQGHRRIRDIAVVQAFVAWVRRLPSGRSGLPWDHRDRGNEDPSSQGRRTIGCS
jgi:hypothetical protein